MIKAISISILLLITLQSYSQDSLSYNFILTGIIGVQSNIPLGDVMIILEDDLVYTNEAGEFDVKTDGNSIDIRIHHLGFDLIDTTFQTSSLKNKTEILLISNCWVTKELAIADIKNNKIKLLLAGGFSPTYFQGQEKIEERFSFEYNDYGCSPPAFECMKAYNNEMFKYLDEKHGEAWHSAVRSDVIGLEEFWKK